MAIATSYFHDLFPQGTKSVMLEEIEASADGKQWLVTLGYTSNTVRSIYGFDREYKTFTINRLTGEVVSVKIRSVK